MVGKHPRSRTSACVRSLVTACVLMAGLSVAVSALAATHPKLVKDINPDGAPSDPDELANVAGMLFFSAYDDDHGTELWKSDGTEGGTKLVKDIRPGGGLGGGSVPEEITSFRGLAFFRADDDAHSGFELWRSDGTRRGTRLVKDIDPPAGSEPGDFATVGRTLFFSAHETVDGYGLWKSDGTKRGTKLVKHVQAEQLTNSGGTLFFKASDATHGDELWTSDGTKAGTRILTDDVNPGPDSSYPDYLINAGGTLFFDLWNGSQNWLWKSDGTKAGTKVVKRVDATYNANLGGTLFFNGDESTHGEELRKSDGTKQGTALVKDINNTSPGADSFPANLTNAGDTLFFQANDGTHGVELWKSDGTRSGTRLVKDIDPNGSDSSDPEDLTASGGRLYFQAFDGTHGYELWRSDGTRTGTKVVDINPDSGSSYAANLTDVAGTLFLQADDGTHGAELWKVSSG